MIKSYVPFDLNWFLRWAMWPICASFYMFYMMGLFKIWSLMARSQCRVSNTQVTVKARLHFWYKIKLKVIFYSYTFMNMIIKFYKYANWIIQSCFVIILFKSIHFKWNDWFLFNTTALYLFTLQYFFYWLWIHLSNKKKRVIKCAENLLTWL